MIEYESGWMCCGVQRLEAMRQLVDLVFTVTFKAITSDQNKEKDVTHEVKINDVAKHKPEIELSEALESPTDPRATGEGTEDISPENVMGDLQRDQNEERPAFWQ